MKRMLDILYINTENFKCVSSIFIFLIPVRNSAISYEDMCSLLKPQGVPRWGAFTISKWRSSTWCERPNIPQQQPWMLHHWMSLIFSVQSIHLWMDPVHKKELGNTVHITTLPSNLATRSMNLQVAMKHPKKLKDFRLDIRVIRTDLRDCIFLPCCALLGDSIICLSNRMPLFSVGSRET